MNRKIISLVGMLVLLLTVLPVATAQPPVADKIEGYLLDRFAVEGTADMVVRMVEQADLSAAYTMGWQERGQFVYNTLLATATRTQEAVVKYLDSHGVRHDTFIAGNEVYVWGGNLELANALASFPAVASIRAARTYYIDPILSEAPESPDVLAWGIAYVNADDFWAAFGMQGDGIVVANIDTGVQYDHPALDQAFRCPGQPGNAECWSDPSNICGGTACDNNGHGTHTMGTMVADDDPSLTYQAGMAPNAQWIACKGCETNSCSEFALNSCADWIVAPNGNPAARPHVVNNSWGGGSCDTWYLAKVNAWRAAGTFPAFSAGNTGSACNTIGTPGDYQESFASAAIDSSGNIASFSGRGPSCFGHDPYTKPNIAAPGVSVCSSIPGNGWSCGYSGTSMASPHSAGAVALLWSCNPGLIGNMATTFEALQDNAGAAPAGNCGAPPDGEGNYTYGYGYLDVYNVGVAWCGDIGYLEGHVYDSSDNSPIDGATVYAGMGSTTTGADGYYHMTLVVGTYDVTATHPLYLPEYATGVDITANATTTQDFYLDPQATGDLYGYVTDAGTGAPLAATVTADDGTTVVTDPGTGRYDMTLVAGTYAVTATATGFTSESATVVIPAGGQTRQDFALTFVPVWMPGPSVSPFQYNRFDGVFNPVDNLIYFPGGRTGGSTHDRGIWTYDPLNDVWADTTCDMMQNAANNTAVLLMDDGTSRGEAIYVFGGYDVIAAANINAVQRYYPSQAGCVVETVTSDPYPDQCSAGRYCGASGVAEVDGKVYVFGGWDSNPVAFSDRTYEYDPAQAAGSRWQQITTANLPSARSYINVAVQGGLVYAMGGHINYTGSDLEPTNTAYRLDPNNLAAGWVAIASMPVATAEGRGFGFDVDTYGEQPPTGKIYVVGGGDWPDVSAEVLEYDVATNTWDDTFPELIAARRDHAGVFVPLCTNDPSDGLPAMWVFGGRTTSDEPPFGDPEYFPFPCVNLQPPTADFTANPTEGCVPLTVEFTDLSGGTPPIDTWVWDFGDGTVVTETMSTNPTHTYTMVGDYTVWLTVESVSGTDSISDVITVNPVAEASFDYAPASGLVPLTVYFTNTSQYALNPVWDFGDGGSATGDNVSHTYTDTMLYTVTLTVDSMYGCDPAMAYGLVNVYFAGPPIAGLEAVPMAGYEPLTVQFTDMSVGTPPIDTWVWDFGDGTVVTETMSTNPTHTYGTMGTYPVMLTVESVSGTDSVSLDIEVWPEPMASFDQDATYGPIPLTVHFTNTSQYAISPTWSFGDGAYGAGDYVSHTYGITGTYVVVLTVTSPYSDVIATAVGQVEAGRECEQVQILTHTVVISGCVVDFALDVTGDPPYTYLWAFGDGMTSTLEAPTYDYGASGTYTVTADVWNCDDNGHAVETFQVTVDCTPPMNYIYLPLVMVSR